MRAAKITIAICLLGAQLWGCGRDGERTVGEGKPGGSEPLVAYAFEKRGAPPSRYSEGLFALDPRTGESRRLPTEDFSGVDAQFPFAYTDGMVVYRCSAGACMLEVADPAARPSTLGDAHWLVPSQRAGQVWLVASERGGETVRAADLSGEVTAPRSMLPRGWLHRPVAAFEDGVLLPRASSDSSRAALIAWDARAGRIAARISDDAFAASAYGTLVASYVGGPVGAKELRLTDLSDGAERFVAAPAPWRFAVSYDGAFSPDGTLLAVPVISRQGRRGEHPRGAALVEVASGAVEVLYAREARSLSFSADGSTLYALTPPEGKARGARITAYDVDRDEALELHSPGLELVHLSAGGG